MKCFFSQSNPKREEGRTKNFGLFFSFLFFACKLLIERERERGRGRVKGLGKQEEKERVFYGMGWDLFFGLLTLAW